jgi:uncharacterized membrane protein
MQPLPPPDGPDGDVGEPPVHSPEAVAPAGAPFPPPEITSMPPDADDDVRDPDKVLVGVSFDRLIRAQEFVLAIRRLQQSGVLELEDAVIVVKEADGRARVTETVDLSTGRAALSGAVWTGLLGLLFGGPVGWIAGLGLGAGAGAITAKVVDLGVPDEWVDWFKQAARPGTTTVVILANHVHIGALEAEARRFPGAEVLHTTLSARTWTELQDAFDGR